MQKFQVGDRVRRTSYPATGTVVGVMDGRVAVNFDAESQKRFLFDIFFIDGKRYQGYIMAEEKWELIEQPQVSQPEVTRRSILDAAAKCVCQDREQQYGAPEDNFARIAQLWDAYKPCGFTAHDVGIMLALLKIGRITTGRFKDDTYIDAVGYLSCAGEIAYRDSAHA